SGSFVVRPGRFPASRSAWRTHRRSASTVQPNFSATDRIVAHCDGCSWAWSKTIRTARSRSSGEYLLGRGMGSILSRNEPSDKPGTIHRAVDSSLVEIDAPVAILYDPRRVSGSGHFRSTALVR